MKKEEIKKFITDQRAALRTALDALEAFAAEIAGDAEAEVHPERVRMWCVKTYWGWGLWDGATIAALPSAPAADEKSFPVWCEKTRIVGADHLTEHKPAPGDVITACGTVTAYRIVAMDTGEAHREEYEHMCAFDCGGK